MRLSALMTARRCRVPFLALTAGLGAAAALATGGVASALAGTGSETAARVAVTATVSHRAQVTATAASAPAGSWRKLPAAPITKPAEGSVVSVWTGHEMIIHGLRFPPTGGIRGVTFAYRPATRTWVRLANGPSRSSAYETTDVAVWTGSRMLVPGQTSGIYDAGTNTWHKIAPAPMSLYGAVTGWTGHRFLAWGGTCCDDTSNGGAAYNPPTDTWRLFPTAPLAPRRDAAGVWTGKELVVAGGAAPRPDHTLRLLRGAAAYNPVTRTWRKLAPMPLSRWGATAVWDGKDILFLGGQTGGPGQLAVRGLAYNPAANRWRWLPKMPYPRSGFAAVWTGRQVLVWGGLTAAHIPPPHGEAYTPATGKWTALPTAPLRGRADPTAVWTGRQMIVWGGAGFTDGAAYTPRTP